MTPYRTPCPPVHEPAATEDGGLRLAFAVMTVVAGVQVGTAILHPALPAAQTLFGTACFLAGAACLVRHHRRYAQPAGASGAGSRSR